jgi:concanavalin A-like lectin/glucanase superfamily protein
MKKFLVSSFLFLIIASPSWAAITDDLVAYWDLEEASGTRVDSAGANDLTSINAPGNAGGKVGNGVDLVRTSGQGLSVGDNAAISMGNFSFSVVCWVKPASTGQTSEIIGKTDGGGMEFGLTIRGSDAYRFEVDNSDAYANVTQSPDTGTASIGNWDFLVGVHDVVNQTVGISVNGGTIQTSPYNLGSWDSNKPLYIGTDSVGDDYDGVIDECGIWKRALDSSDIAFLYNGGAGRDFAGLSSTPSAKKRMTVVVE